MFKHYFKENKTYAHHSCSHKSVLSSSFFKLLQHFLEEAEIVTKPQAGRVTYKCALCSG